MLIALISDIHGNLSALEAVLADIAHEQPDQVVCLGDVAAFGPQPREVIARLQVLNPLTVTGNTDAWLLDPKPYPIRDENSHCFNDVELWSAQQLTEADKSYLRAFSPTIELGLADGVNLLGYHGSPRDFNEGIFPDTFEADFGDLFAGHDALVFAGGHIHEQFLRRYRQSYILNPGSVGLPWERLPSGETRNPPWAEYALLGWQNQRLSVDFRRIPYDLDALRRVVRAADMPHADWWLADWRATR